MDSLKSFRDRPADDRTEAVFKSAVLYRIELLQTNSSKSAKIWGTDPCFDKQEENNCLRDIRFKTDSMLGAFSRPKVQSTLTKYEIENWNAASKVNSDIQDATWWGDRPAAVLSACQGIGRLKKPLKKLKRS